jgi:hypothetical protein
VGESGGEGEEVLEWPSRMVEKQSDRDAFNF